MLVTLGQCQNKMSVNCADSNYTRLRRKSPKTVQVSARKERNLSIKKVSVILQKKETERTKEEQDLLFNYSEVVSEASLRLERRQKLKDRAQEIEDSETVLEEKCKALAAAVTNAKYLVVYTGAGISTAARIPDYRGTSGIWTLLQQGKDIGCHDLTQAEPTFTHMALSQLYRLGMLQHVVSQNCDGLHLRSGLPRTALSEVHGNMYIEVCKACRPVMEYLRLFDVTENTARYSHRTLRRCYRCQSPLIDCIVHFGERGTLPWPLNWKGACRAAEKADAILCIGSSLKVLKRYPWLWSMDKPAKRRPSLYIVNLQWTPKDCHAAVKINGKCDEVMKKLMKHLAIQVADYSRGEDPIFVHATELCKEERHTTNRPCLSLVKKEEDEPADTGQSDIILITIKTEDCCPGFKTDERHDAECANHIDEDKDIPVIMQEVVKAERTEPTAFSMDSILARPSPAVPPPYLPCLNLLPNYFPSYNPLIASLFTPNYLVPNLGLVLPMFQQNLPEGSSVKREPDRRDREEEPKKPRMAPEPRVGLMTNRNTQVTGPKKQPRKDTAKCSYCKARFSSNSCLFYVKKEASFRGNPATVCECCSDENEAEEKTTEDEGKTTEDEERTGELLKQTTNPGWYGKGYKKHFKKKR